MPNKEYQTREEVQEMRRKQRKRGKRRRRPEAEAENNHQGRPHQDRPRPRPKKKKKRRGGFRTFLGILMILIALGLLAINPVKDYLIARNTEANTVGNITREQIEANQQADVTYNFEDISNINAADVIRSGVNPDHLPTIGGIAVPELKINLPIYKGVSNEGMFFGAGTLSPNQRMGESNYPLASHHSIHKDLLFAPLLHAEIGQKIYITDLKNIYEYEINFVEHVPAERVDLIAPTPEGATPIITLVTCDSDLVNRVVIQGELKGKTPVEQATQEMQDAFQLPQTIAGLG